MYKRKIKGWAKHSDFIFLDCLCLALSFIVSYYARMHNFDLFESSTYKEIFIIIVLINFIILLLLDTLKNVLKRGYYLEFSATIKQSLVLLLAIALYLFGTKHGSDYSRIIIILTIIIHTILTYILRLLWKLVVKKRFHKNLNCALLIMASESSVPELIEQINTGYDNHEIVGIVLHDKSKLNKKINDINVVSTHNTIVEYVNKNWVDEVLISLKPAEELPINIINDLTSMGVSVHLNLDKSVQPIGSKQVIGHVGKLLVVTSTINYMKPRQYFAKRTMDIIGSIIGCLITCILYLIFAPIIKIKSPGPVIFKQERVGKNGKTFILYKFRSMDIDAEEKKKDFVNQNKRNDGYMFKMDFDPRIIGNHIDKNGNKKTGFGEFIRKYSLDEFPQFYNVLRGDMSIVGTRPPLVSEYENYPAEYKIRLAIRPGITGLWQVNGRSNVLDFEEVVRLDTQYINNWSIGQDIKITLKTFFVVSKKYGSM